MQNILVQIFYYCIMFFPFYLLNCNTHCFLAVIYFNLQFQKSQWKKIIKNSSDHSNVFFKICFHVKYTFKLIQFYALYTSINLMKNVIIIVCKIVMSVHFCRCFNFIVCDSIQFINKIISFFYINKSICAQQLFVIKLIFYA